MFSHRHMHIGARTNFGIEMVLITVVVFFSSLDQQAQQSTNSSGDNGLEMSLWAKEPMLKNPVALTFDDDGTLYVVETARRSTVDIDIRSHKEWIIEDLANQSVSDLRDFFRRKMAPELSDTNRKWLKDRNNDEVHDWRDLMEVQEKVHRIQDTDGDGKADKAQVFFEGFNEEINGVIAGVMPNGKDVLVTVYPDLWRLRDHDGDGVADEKESLFRGFGVHAAFDGHDIHGLTWGPDGRIYFSVGDNGFSVTNKEGRKLHYPNTGGVLRMNPDYSNLEVFAYGLRNVQEIAFDKYGNLFSVDNDGDLEDERERFVYITEGSDHGWRLNWQFRTKGWAKFTKQPDYNPWTAGGMWKPHFEGQPAHITPPLSNYSVGPGGFKYNPGTALNEKYQDFFFCVQFPVKKTTAFKATPKGAYFEMSDEHIFHSGLMISSVNFAPGGGIYLADWDGMWSPNEKGAIYKVDDPKSSSSPIRQQVHGLLANGVSDQSNPDLAKLLSHPDQRIRQAAQFELSRRQEMDLFIRIANERKEHQLSRIHALWGIGQTHRAGVAIKDKTLPFNDPDSEIRAQAAKVAGELKLTQFADSLEHMLWDGSPRVQFFAAMSLGQCGGKEMTESLFKLLEKNAGKDAYIRHACVMGLTGMGDIESLTQARNHPSHEVRIGAVLALRRMKSPSVTNFLSDPHLLVQREAVSAIHDDFSIPEALPALAQRLQSPDLPNDEAIIRRSISANLRLGGEAQATRLIQYALEESHEEQLRVEALESLSDWNNHPFVDRVVGRVRERTPNNPNIAKELLTLNLGQLLQGPETMVKVTTQIAQDQGLEMNNDTLVDWIRSGERSPKIRSQALKLLAQRDAKNLESILELALKSEVSALQVSAWNVLASFSKEAFIKKVDLNFWDLGLREQQSILKILTSVESPLVDELLQQTLDMFIANSLPKELQLDVINAVRNKKQPELISKLKLIQSRFDEKDPLSRYSSALHGGDRKMGQEIYQNHVAAQCVRCHNAGGEGKQVGPDLSGVGTRFSREYLLQSLVDPSAVIAEGYQFSVVNLKNGDSISGIIESQEKDTLSIRTSDGSLKKFDAKEIDGKNLVSASSMPPMGLLLKPNEIRDLVEYLASQKD